jgi:hypothetical protein
MASLADSAIQVKQCALDSGDYERLKLSTAGQRYGYSSRSAVIGSNCVARLAGKSVAMAAVIASRAPAKIKVSGSFAFNSKSSDSAYHDKNSDAMTPSDNPAATMIIASFAINR